MIIDPLAALGQPCLDYAGAPSFQMGLRGGRTFASETAGDVPDLMGRLGTGVRTGGCTWGSGRRGGGLTLDGTTGYATWPPIRTAGLFYCSVRHTRAAAGAPSGSIPLLFNGTLYPSVLDWYFWISFAGVMEFGLKLGAGAGVISLLDATVGASQGLVTTYGFGYDGATQWIDQNGVRVASQAKTGAVGLTSDALVLGKYQTNFCEGFVDDVRYYDYAPTADAIRLDYLDQSRRFRAARRPTSAAAVATVRGSRSYPRGVGRGIERGNA
jgi:hypothetical protein